MRNPTRLSRIILVLTLLIALCAGVVSTSPRGVEAKPNQLQATNVVISEFRTRGDTVGNEATDEFIEIYNPTTSTIPIGGYKLRRSSSCAISTFDLYTFPNGINLLPGQYYLVASSNYSGTTTPDVLLPSTMGIADDGGIAITDATNNPIDQVGMCIGTQYKEGTVLSALNTNVDRSYERKLGTPLDSCLDDGINSTDFQILNPSNPQNSLTPRRGCGFSSDLQLLQSVSDPTPTTGTNIDFILTILNNGTNDATGVSVKDVLPAGIAYQSSIATLGAYDDTTGIWSIGNLNVGISATLTITVTVTSFGAKTNIAEIWTSGQVDPDSIVGNSVISEDDYTFTQVTPPKISGLVITNTVNNPSPLVGANVVFTVVVSNPAPNLYPATNVNVAAPIPAGVNYISSSTSTGSYAAGNWNIGNLAVGMSATLTVTVKVVSSVPGVFNATLSSDEYITVSDDAPFTPTPLSGQANLTINQSIGLNTGTAGQVNLIISLNNTGPDNATGVSVRDLLPSGLTYVSHTTATGTYNANTGIWSIGNLTNGANVTLTLKVRVAASGASTNNMVQVWSSNQFDSDLSDNSKSLEVPISDLSLIQTVDITPGTAIFAITVTNSGPDDATVQVKSNLPDVASTYTYVSSGASQGSYSSASGIWNIGLLADGATATLVITTSTVGTLQSHIVEIYSSDMVDPDSIPNNKARLEDDISGLPYADLSLTQTVNTSTLNVGANVVFTIRVINSGPISVTGLTVKDVLPAGLTYVSSSTASGSYAPGTGIWTVGSLASGAQAQLTITANVSVSGSFINQAEISKSGLYDPDSTPANGINGEDDISNVTVATTSVVRAIIINEVAWAGTTSSLTSDEWIELYNTTNAAINLTGWTLKATDGTPSITLNGSIPAGGYFLLERDDDNTVSDILADQVYIGELSNSGEILTLFDGTNNAIDTANGNGGSWPAGSSSTYGTMERTSTSTDSDSIWRTNTGVKKNGKNANGGDILGTPKQSNSVVTTSATVTPEPTPTPTLPPVPIPIDPRPIINEILARPGFDWNQDGKTDVQDEFIEIKNLTAIDISLSGWRLDEFTPPGEPSKSFSLPGVTLKPGERIVYYGKQTDILLSDGGETVRLISPNGKIYDAFTYDIARAEDQSFCRLPDGNPGDSWFEDCTPTPNLTNTREGKAPVSPDGNTSTVCNLPDTVPLDFFIPECNGYGADIWNPFYWDFANWIDKLWIRQTGEKWRSFFE